MKKLILIIGLGCLLFSCEKTEIGEQHNYKYLGSPGYYTIKFTTYKDHSFEVRGDTFIYEFRGDRTPLNIEVTNQQLNSEVTVSILDNNELIYTETKKGSR